MGGESRHETAEASTVDHMLPKGYLENEHHRLDDRIHHEEHEMQHLFDDVTDHAHGGRDEERAEDKFVDKIKHLTGTTWGLKKRKLMSANVDDVNGGKTANGVVVTSRHVITPSDVTHSYDDKQANQQSNSLMKSSLFHPVSKSSIGGHQNILGKVGKLATTVLAKQKLRFGTGEKRHLPTKMANKKESASTNTVSNTVAKKQTIDNSLVNTASLTSSNTNLKGVLNGLSTGSEPKANGGNDMDSIHDNSLLSAYVSRSNHATVEQHGDGVVQQRSMADLSNLDVNLLKSSFQPEQVHQEQEERAVQANNEKILDDAVHRMEPDHNNQHEHRGGHEQRNSTFGEDAGDSEDTTDEGPGRKEHR